MQPTRTILTILVGEIPSIIPVKAGQYPVNGFRGVVLFKIFKHHRQARKSTKAAVLFTI